MRTVFLILFLSSCLKYQGGGSSEGKINQANKVVPQNDSVDGVDQLDYERGEVVLDFIVDPFDKKEKSKVSIPRNYNKLLYLTGINLFSLTNRLIFVRFRFGREMSEIVIPGTIARSSGMIPATDKLVLILDMKDRPFENVRLLYDLFDYNDYRDENGDETYEPVMNPRSSGLYCRGLPLKYDPTFVRTEDHPLCNREGDICHYAYAKLLDSGLFTGDGRRFTVFEPQIDMEGGGYDEQGSTEILKKCLPDNNDVNHLQGVLNISSLGSVSYGASVSLDGESYFYRGPFYPVNTNEWQITGDAVLSVVDSNTGALGLFQHFLDPQSLSGYKSFMFPRAGPMDLKANVQHFSSPEIFPATGRALASLSRSGKTEYMDGCNFRMNTYDPLFNEKISSCNVTATIELFTRDQETGEETTLVVHSDIKLQLTRPEPMKENEILHSLLTYCSGENACPLGECCFNGRCFSELLAPHCSKKSVKKDNRLVGESCTSDYQCASLCCDTSKRRCRVHDENSNPPRLCSKTQGQSCVAQRWCKTVDVHHCEIVPLHNNPNGPQCIQRCSVRPRPARCFNSVCQAPERSNGFNLQFDPAQAADPGYCDNFLSSSS